ncbi:MAG: hypothetical protein PHG90_06295 [Clostridia bacterium]|nr:hypothetical protein [Clostridia bacterium]
MKTTIEKKENSKGEITRLKESLRELPHLSDAERTSFKERSIINPTTTIAPYCGSPGLVIIEIALDEIALDEITLVNMAFLTASLIRGGNEGVIKLLNISKEVM